MKLSNHKLHPFHMVIVQILHDNPDSTISDSTLNNFTYRNLKPRTPVEGEEPPRNATIEIDLIGAPSDVDGDWVEFAFRRYDLQELFASVIAAGQNTINEWDVTTDDNGVILSGFELEMEKRFDLYMDESEDHYEFIATPYKMLMRAKETNPAFVGEIEFTVIPGLKSRVDKAQMDGYSTPYQPPEFASEVLISTAELAVGETLDGTFDIWSQHDYDFVLLLDKDYPDLADTNLVEVRRTPMKATSVVGGTDTENVSFTLSTDEIATAIGNEAGRLEDGYSLKVRAVNSAGNATHEHRMFVGYDITDHLSIKYLRSDIVDESTAKAVFQVTTTEQVQTKLTSTGGNTLPSVNGVEQQPDDYFNYIPDQNTVVTIEYNRGENVPMALTFDAYFSDVPGPFRIPYFGQVVFNRTVSTKPADKPVIVTPVSLNKPEYVVGETITATQTVVSEVDFQVKVFATKAYPGDEEVLVKTVDYSQTTELGGDTSASITTRLTTAELETAIGSTQGSLEDSYELRFEVVNEAGPVESLASMTVGMNITDCQVMTFVRTEESDHDSANAVFKITATHTFSATVTGILGTATLSISPDSEGRYTFLGGQDYIVKLDFDRDASVRNIGIKLNGVTMPNATAQRVPTFGQDQFTQEVSMGPTPPPTLTTAINLITDKIEVGGYLAGDVTVRSEDPYRLEVYVDKASISGLGNRVIKIKSYDMPATTATGGSDVAKVDFSVTTDELWAAHDPVLDGSLEDHYLVKVKVVNPAGEDSATDSVMIGYNIKPRFSIAPSETREQTHMFGRQVFVLNCLETFRAIVNVTGNNAFRIDGSDAYQGGSIHTFEAGENYELTVDFLRDGTNKVLRLDLVGHETRPSSGDYTPYWDTRGAQKTAKLNPTPAPIVSKFNIADKTVVYGANVSGNVSVVSEDAYQLQVLISKEYPGTAAVTDLLVKSYNLNPTTVTGGTVEKLINWSFTAAELRAVLPTGTGRVEDIYTVKIKVTNPAGDNHLVDEVVIGYDISNQYSFTYKGTTVVDRDSARASYDLVPVRDNMTFTFRSENGEGNPRIDGVAVSPSQVLSLRGGQTYRVTQDFSRGDSVALRFVANATIADPHSGRIPFFGVKTNNHTVQMVLPDVQVVSEDVTGTDTTYESTQRARVRAKCEIGYSVKWYLDNVLKHTQTVASNISTTEKDFAYDFEVPNADTYAIKVILTAENGRTITKTGSIVRKLKPTIPTKPPLNNKIYLNTNHTFSSVINAREDCTVTWKQRKIGESSWTTFHTQDYTGQAANRTVTAVFKETVKGDYEFNINVRLKSSGQNIGFTYYADLVNKITVGGTCPWSSNQVVDWNSAKCIFTYTPSVTANFRLASVGAGEEGIRLNGGLVNANQNYKLVAGTPYTLSVNFARNSSNQTVAVRLTPQQDTNLPHDEYVGRIDSSKVVNMAPAAVPAVVSLTPNTTNQDLSKNHSGSVVCRSETDFTLKLLVTKRMQGLESNNGLFQNKVAWSSNQTATTGPGGTGTRSVNWAINLAKLQQIFPTTGYGFWADQYRLRMEISSPAGKHYRDVTVGYGYDLNLSITSAYLNLSDIDASKCYANFDIDTDDSLYSILALTGGLRTPQLNGSAIGNNTPYKINVGGNYVARTEVSRGVATSLQLKVSAYQPPEPDPNHPFCFGSKTLNKSVTAPVVKPIVASTTVTGDIETAAINHTFNIVTRCQYAYQVKWYLNNTLKHTEYVNTNPNTNKTCTWNTGTVSVNTHAIRVEVICGSQKITRSATLTRTGTISLSTPLPSTVEIEQNGDTVGVGVKTPVEARVNYYIRKKGTTSWTHAFGKVIPGASGEQWVQGNVNINESADYELKVDAYFTSDSSVKVSDTATVIPFRRIAISGVVSYYSIETLDNSKSYCRFRFNHKEGAVYRLEQTNENHGNFRVNGSTMVANNGNFNFSQANGYTYIDVPFPRDGNNHTVGVRCVPQNTRYVKYSGNASASRICNDSAPEVTINFESAYNDGGAMFSAMARVQANFQPTGVTTTYSVRAADGYSRDGSGLNINLDANGVSHTITFTWSGYAGSELITRTVTKTVSYRSSYPRITIIETGSVQLASNRFENFVRFQLSCFQTNMRANFENGKGQNQFINHGDVTPSTRATHKCESSYHTWSGRVLTASDQGNWSVNVKYL